MSEKRPHFADFAINPILGMIHYYHHNGTYPSSKKIIGEVGPFLRHAYIDLMAYPPLQRCYQVVGLREGV